MDIALVVALALLLVGVAGSVLPLVPGVPLSLLGIYGYWWRSGFTDPGVPFVVAVTVVGVAAILADYVGGAVAARAGGASRVAAVVAALAGVVGLLLAGPVGMLVGVAGGVFAVEVVTTRDARHGLKSAAYATVGMAASAVFQLLVTLTMLVAFVVAVIV
jgi:uncharacterized protein YqgC (DUF456 family)